VTAARNPALRNRSASALLSPVRISCPPSGSRQLAARLKTSTQTGETWDRPRPSTSSCRCPVRISAASCAPRSATVSAASSPDRRISAFRWRALTSMEQHASGCPLLGRLLLRHFIRCRVCHRGTFPPTITELSVGLETPTHSPPRSCTPRPASDCRPGVVAKGFCVVMIAATGLRQSPATEVAKGQKHDIEPGPVGTKTIGVAARGLDHVRRDQQRPRTARTLSS
jgi:hypothetical protein